MKEHSQLSPKEEGKVIRRQYGAAILSFLLVFPLVFLSMYIFNGSIRLVILPFSLAALLVGISSIRHRISILRLKGKKKPARGKTAAVIGVLLLVAAFLQAVFALAPSFSNTLFALLYSGYYGSSQATFDNLPVHHAGESGSGYYQAADSPQFVEINSYTNISAWGAYRAVPLAIVDDMVLVSGDISAEYRSGVNSNLINANAVTGEANWYGFASRSGFLLADSNRVYVESANQQFGGATGIASYDIRSGKKIWETAFDRAYAIGVSNSTLADSGINARTYHRGKEAFYVLDKEGGQITAFLDEGGFIFAIENGTKYEWFGDLLRASGQVNWETDLDSAAFHDRDLAAPVVSGDLIIVKDGHRSSGPITAVNKDDGDIVWKFNQNVVSNVAVGGATTYFVTKQAELLALDTNSGEYLGSLEFTPNFSEAFDFVNTSIFVAADGSRVAVYFEDTRQLSIFRLSLARNQPAISSVSE